MASPVPWSLAKELDDEVDSPESGLQMFQLDAIFRVGAHPAQALAIQ